MGDNIRFNSCGDLELWLNGELEASWHRREIPVESLEVISNIIQKAYEAGKRDRNVEFCKFIGAK